MKNTSCPSIYSSPATDLAKRAACLSAIALIQAVFFTVPAQAANPATNPPTSAPTTAGVNLTSSQSSTGSGAAILPRVQSPMQITPSASITDAPPASVSNATPASSASKLEQSVQATMVTAVSGEAIAGQIDNFEMVSNGLWRGALPSHKAIASMAKSGVKTIIDLRYAGAGVEEEAQVAKQCGINYVNIPLGFKNPSLGNVARFLAIVSKPANQPVFVHCRQGADRTGTVVGVFRILHDHWSFAEAYNEMRLHHFKPWLGNLKSLVARCEVDPKISRELSEMASKLEEPVNPAKLSSKSQPSSI